MIKKILYTLLLLFSINSLVAGGTEDLIKRKAKKKKEEAGGFSIKLIPGFFWETAGLEFELPLGGMVSLSLNGHYKYGNADQDKIQFIYGPEAYVENGYRAELAFKFYFGKTAPLGFYAQLQGGYTNIIYFDGTTRPFTVNSNWKEQKLNTPGFIETPQPYEGGLGFGYQLDVSDGVVFNIFAGAQVNFDKANNLFYSFFLTPSIGYKF